MSSVARGAPTHGADGHAREPGIGRVEMKSFEPCLCGDPACGRCFSQERDDGVPNDEASQRYAGEMEAAILNALERLVEIRDASPKRQTTALIQGLHDSLLVLMDKIGDERDA